MERQPQPVQTRALPTPEPSPSEEMLRTIQEHAEDFRAIIRKLRRSLTRDARGWPLAVRSSRDARRLEPARALVSWPSLDRTFRLTEAIPGRYK